MRGSKGVKAKHVLIAILLIVVIFLVGIGSYYGITKIFGVDNKNNKTSVNKQVIASNITMGRKTCNLIYSMNVNNNIVNGAILEFFDITTGKIDYVTVPDNIKITVDKDTIEEIGQYGYLIEDTISLKNLIDIFGQKNAYQFGQILLEKALGIKISYYTVFQDKILAKYFVKNRREFYLDVNKKKEKYSYEMYEISETYKTKCEEDELKPKELIEEAYKELESNYIKENKYFGLEGYEKAEMNKIYYWHLVGNKKYNQFVCEDKINDTLFDFILKRKKQYKRSQVEYNKVCQKAEASK
jgi:hypothetical protein